MGKFGKDNFDKGNEWRVDLKNQLESFCCDYKVKVSNPNDYYNFLDNSTYDSEQEIMEFDINKVRNADLCIVNFNDLSSLGSMAELTIAYERRIPVIGLCENGELNKLHPWQKCMVNKMFTSRDDLTFYILKYYLQ